MEDKRKKLARQVAGLIEVLPPMPENISRLMKADVDPHEGHKHVLALIADDPGLCTDFLH